MAELPPIYGLVLAGGQSRRMQTDKALLDYHGKPQLVWTCELLSGYCERVFVSVGTAQAGEQTRASRPIIVDAEPDLGPAGGIASAQACHPDAAWLVLACDLPFLTGTTLSYLIEHRNPRGDATAFRSTHDGLPEPLCSIWEPRSAIVVREALDADRRCPRKMLIDARTTLLEQPTPCALDNVNTREEWRDARERFGADGPPA